MFDFVHDNKRLVQIILGLITLPFAFWGIESYRNSGNGSGIAAVDGAKISASEFDQALRSEQNRMRQSLGANFDAAMLDSPEFKLSVVENLVQQKLLLNQAAKDRLQVTDSQLISYIQDIPAFAQDGHFSQSKYEALLRNQGMTPVYFEARVREDLVREQLAEAAGSHDFVSHSQALQVAKLLDQKREMSQVTLSPQAYLASQKIDSAAVQSYYDKHQDEFKVPQQAKVEYLTLSRDSLLPSVSVSEDEARKYYDERKDSEFTGKEERQASHILISLPKGATAAQIDEARGRAKKLADELQRDPAKFAEYAKKYSQDPGSAANGGDLGFFGRGMMVKPFDDAVFAMKVGAVSNPVQSDFGFHIIKLEAVKGAGVQSFEQAHDRIMLELKQQKAGQKFSEIAENFSNLVYEQSDSLKPAADAYKLQIQSSGWLTKSGGDPAFPNNPKLLAAIFSDDALNKKRNTEAIEVAPNTLVSARVVESKPAYTRPFAEVSAGIEQKLRLQAASDAAAKDGKAKLAQLLAGKDAGVSFAAPQAVGRNDRAAASPQVLDELFKADTSKLPAYIGVDTPQGYALVKITKVIEPADPDATQRQALEGQLRRVLSQEELSAYLASLKQKAKITVNQLLLVGKQ